MNCYIGEASRSYGAEPFTVFYRNLDKLALSGASRRFVITEEHPMSINDGLFFLQTQSTTLKLIDYPSSWHNGSGNLVFADGHVLTKHWFDPRTKPPLDATLKVETSTNNPDVLWLNSVATDPW